MSATAQASVPSGMPIPGVRPQGMGGAFVAVADDVNTLALNPAGLAIIKDRQVHVSHSDLYGTGVDFNYLAYAQKSFGASWAHMDSGSYLMGPAGIGGGLYKQDMFTIGGAMLVQPQLYAGASIKILRESYSPPTSNGTVLGEAVGSDGYAFDVGVLYIVDANTTVGAVARDVQGKLRSSKTPNSACLDKCSDKFTPDVNVGFARRTKDALFTGEVGRVGGESVVRVGVEKKVYKQLTLRAGIEDEVFTAGVGFGQNQWQFDFAYKNSSGFGVDKTSRFGALVHF
jgi:hypothetical protein